MSRKHYDYSNKPKIAYHSVIKHKILRDYIKAYVAKLTGDVRIDQFKLAIVDGFAGGGKFSADWNNDTVYGSPFTILEACEEALANAQLLRKKLFRLDARFYFVEEDSDGHRLLYEALIEKGYARRVNTDQDIFLFQDDFKERVGFIVQDIKKRSISARSIFLLDQYGYSEVPQDLVRSIFSELPGAEILLTFNVDSLLNYLNEKNLKDFSKNTGFSIEALLDSGFQNKEKRPADWRLAAQAILHKGLVTGCFPDGQGYHTTFYIRATGGHGDYWLVHLSRNITARNVMVDIHWLHGNHFVHYGGSGLDMYCLRGFNTSAEADMFGFNTDARATTMHALHSQLPRLIYDFYPQGISFRELQIQQANYTPARGEDIREAFHHIDLRRDLLIVSADGRPRHNRTLPRDQDFIVPNPQSRFIL